MRWYVLTCKLSSHINYTCFYSCFLIFRWLGPDIPASIAVQKLSHAVGTMNKILLPVFVAHTSIIEALSGRKRTRYSFPKPSYRNSQTVRATSSSSSFSVSALDTTNVQAGIISNMGCRGSSSGCGSSANAGLETVAVVACAEGILREQTRKSTAEFNAGHVADDTTVGPLLETPDLSMLSCFNNWLDFIDRTSELVAVEITPASICDSFFKTKSGGRNNLQIFQNGSEETSGIAICPVRRMSKSTDSGVLPMNKAENRSSTSFGDPIISGIKLGNLSVLNHNCTNQSSNITGYQDSRSTAQKEVVMKSACNHVAALLINGLLTMDEASRAEEYLEGQRATMESKVQDLLHDLYSYPIGRGAENPMDTPDQKVRNYPPSLLHSF